MSHDDKIKDMLDEALAPIVIHRTPMRAEKWITKTPIDNRIIVCGRLYRDPLTRVGPVRSGILRPFDEPKP